MDLGSIGDWVVAGGTAVLAGLGIWTYKEGQRIKLRVVGEVRDFTVNGVTEKLPVLSITNKTDHIVTITNAFWISVPESHAGAIYLNHQPLPDTDLKSFPFSLQKGEMGQVLIAHQNYREWVKSIIQRYAGSADTLTFAGRLRFYAVHSLEGNGLVEGEPTDDLYRALKKYGSLLRKSTPQPSKQGAK